MKLHFRYHTYLSIKDGDIYEECRYCKDRLENDKNRKIASNENENEKGDKMAYIPGGTQYEATQVNDVIELGQANRGIIEFDYDNPGRYMFHAHVQEFTDLGWMGLFDVKQENATSAGT